MRAFVTALSNLLTCVDLPSTHIFLSTVTLTIWRGQADIWHCGDIRWISPHIVIVEQIGRMEEENEFQAGFTGRRRLEENLFLFRYSVESMTEGPVSFSDVRYKNDFQARNSNVT